MDAETRTPSGGPLASRFVAPWEFPPASRRCQLEAEVEGGA